MWCERVFTCWTSRNGDEVGLAHGEFFGSVKPAASMMQVAKLIDPEMLVETEADAYITDS